MSNPPHSRIKSFCRSCRGFVLELAKLTGITDARRAGESAVMFRTILKLLTALAFGAFASVAFAQQNAAPQPVPYLNAQAKPPAAATPSAQPAQQVAAPAAAQSAPAAATAAMK